MLGASSSPRESAYLKAELPSASEKEATKKSVATGVDVYFCDPPRLWKRGSNENTNGILRQYFPKGTDLAVHSQRHLDKVALGQIGLSSRWRPT